MSELQEIRDELRSLREMIQAIVKQSGPTIERDLTISEVAKLMRVSRSKVFGWMRAGQLRAHNIGRDRRVYRVAPAELDRLRALLGVEPERTQTRRRSNRRVGQFYDLATGERLKSQL